MGLRSSVRGSASLLGLLTAVLLAGAAAPAGARSHPGRARRVALTSRLLRIQRRKNETLHQIARTKDRQRNVINDLQQIQTNLLLTTRRIDRTRVRLRATNGALIRTEARLAGAEASMERDRRRLARRMVAAHRGDDAGYLSVLLGARSLWDLLDRAHLVSRIVHSDADLIRALAEEESTIRTAAADLRRKRALEQSLAADLERQRAAQRQAYDEQKAVYARLRHEREALEQALEQQDRDSDGVRAMLQALAQTPEGRSRAAVAWTGSFVRPVDGPVTSGFGRRFHPILHVWKLHTGVDFGVPPGTPVHAAAGGVVVHAGWLGAYGFAVILDHGGGVSTLYGHNSYVDVRVGQTVSAGELISHSGSTGYSTGPHVHFEKRVNGSPVPPF